MLFTFSLLSRARAEARSFPAPPNVWFSIASTTPRKRPGLDCADLLSFTCKIKKGSAAASLVSNLLRLAVQVKRFMDTELGKHLYARDFAIFQFRHLRWFLILRHGTDNAAQLTILS